MRLEANLQRRGGRSSPGFSGLLASPGSLVTPLHRGKSGKRNQIRRHQPQELTVRESGVGPNSQMDVVGEATSGEEAVEKVCARQPDIVIMELAIPGMDGIRATRAIAALGLSTQVLIFTVHNEDEYLEPALEAGAAGFLSKSASDTDIMSAVGALVRGHSYLPHRAASLLARRKARSALADNPEPGVLSSRELTVVTLYAKGYTVGEMGKHVFLSPRTVEGYLARAKNKLGLNRRSEIVRFALGAGLMGGEEEQRQSVGEPA